ncbi:hypothetical protein M430DRAFT_43642 [Amorphotheca resinae ATCC 22711]|uniref:Uncharacterized protein n=1 Tax=Amorphotheca resinae ATCC 22711 TaxID=857342 RepID=A0A2T3AVV1_AMORE|nr:hypothetical protein M430DRAFT_43642 [Amorphotheca resinae ATCC 22711]PSS12802.1 hypothetical protein M430DRAFT_43642 [Amorphotheca resinae ATCC 22711]
MASRPRAASNHPSSPPPRSPPPPPPPQEESVIDRLLIAPLTFISFLLSLALIDSRNHNLRYQHTPAAATFLGRISGFIHNLVYKPIPDSSPYAYLNSPAARDAKEGGRARATSGETDREEESWHWHSKQRQQMKAEISDAFRVRKWVLYALVGIAASAVVGAWVMAKWMLYFLASLVWN